METEETNKHQMIDSAVGISAKSGKDYRRHSDYEVEGAPLGTYKESPEYLHFKIVVKTEEEKKEFLKASEYIHDFVVRGYEKRWSKIGFWGLDSDIMAVNWFMHLYESPCAIEVKPDEKFFGFDFTDCDQKENGGC